MIGELTGRTPSVDSPRRWVRTGVHGIKLRAFATGGRGVSTTREEIARFLAALSAIRGLD